MGLVVFRGYESGFEGFGGVKGGLKGLGRV